MTNEQKNELLRKLVKGTLDGKLKWEILNDDAYQLNFSKSALVLKDHRKKQSLLTFSEAAFTIRLFNAEGISIESLSDEDFKGDSRGELDKIITYIRDKAYKIGDTISDVLEGLE